MHRTLRDVALGASQIRAARLSRKVISLEREISVLELVETNFVRCGMKKAEIPERNARIGLMHA